MKGMSKAIKEVPIPGGETKKHYLYIDNEEGLFGLVQIGALEIHDWGVSLKNIDKPDRLVFDLDPDEEFDFAVLKAAAVRRCAPSSPILASRAFSRRPAAKACISWRRLRRSSAGTR